MTVTIWFATHSTSEDDEAGVASGQRDAPLSATGEEQARRLGEEYADRGVTAVYAADLQRTARTAAIAFGDTEVPIHLDERLREVDYGERTGAPSAEIDAARAEHVTAPFPGGESYAQAIARRATLLDEIAGTHDGETVLVIGCYATWMALEHLAGGRSLDAVARIERTWQPGWRYVYG